MSENQNKLYLGDGVYAIFNGYSVELAANHHENIVITLELEVLDRLNEFVKKQKETYTQ